jgi:hypothetical protein
MDLLMPEPNAPTLARIVTPELSAFGKELLAHGFRVFVFRSDVERVAKGGRESCATTIGFSRVVGEQECFASVSYGLAGYQFDMPIKPSRQHGSSMFIGDTDTMPEFDSLTLDRAELYASPTGFNPLVGTQNNYVDEWHDRLYVEVAG